MNEIQSKCNCNKKIIIIREWFFFLLNIIFTLLGIRKSYLRDIIKTVFGRFYNKNDYIGRTDRNGKK